MKVTFYFPINLEFSDKQIGDIKYIKREYEKLKESSEKFLISKGFVRIKATDPPNVFFHVWQGKTDGTNTKILISNKYPLILFTFCFETPDVSNLGRKVKKFKERANSFFIQFLDLLFQSGKSDKNAWKQHDFLKWRTSFRFYYLFETSEKEEQIQMKKIARSITGQPLQEEYIRSHFCFSEFFKIFYGKSFSAIFFKETKSYISEKNLQMTKNSIRDTFLFSEIILRTLQNVALNSIEQLELAVSEEDLSKWTTGYFADLTEPIRILISNTEPMNGLEEITFEIHSKLDALDQILDNAKLMVNLRSTLQNKLLQQSIDRYTKKLTFYTRILIYLTIIVLFFTVVTILSRGDSLIQNLNDFIYWIQKYLSYSVFLL